MKRLTLLITAAAALALLALPGAALAKSHDRNHDGIPDKWERHFHLSLKHNDAKGDPDHDGLNNKGEFKNHTNPRDADTDNDGLDDGDEVKTANDANDSDTDNNGVKDGEENAGKVASFDSNTGTLVIDLGNNQTVTGQVTPQTEIECKSVQQQENENENEAEHQSGDSQARAAHDGGDDGDHQDAQQQENNCTASDLTQGTTVHEAELHLENGQATFEKVELIK
jgi:hypothetical protein